MALSALQLRTVEALVTLGTQRAAAKASGVAEPTLSGWMRDPEFYRAVREATSSLFAGTARRLQHAAGEATEYLLGCLDPDGGEPDRGRIQAAQLLLHHALRYYEAAQLQAQVDDLEAKVNGGGADVH